MENKINLLRIIWNFIDNEFEDSFEGTEEDALEILNDIDNDCVPIVHSEFGDLIEFTGQTSYIPSKNMIIKDVFSFDYGESYEDPVIFESLDEFNMYLMKNSFDELLQPNMEEEQLIKIVKEKLEQSNS